MRNKIQLFTICLAFLIVPLTGGAQQNEKRIRLNETTVVKIIYGKKDGQFGRKDLEHDVSITPRAFTFDADHNIYIEDSVHEPPRVQVFNSKGQFLENIFFKSKRPYPLVVIDIAVKDGKLYILLYRENIQVFTLAGEPVRTIKYYMDFDLNNEWTDALYYPSKMEVDSIGNIYLSAEAGALAKLDTQGKLLQKWSYVDHYINANDNLFVMELNKEKLGLTVKYASDGHKILESTCEALFPAPLNQKCRLPDFVDKEGKMYRRFHEGFQDGFIARVMKYSKQESLLLETALYVDETSEYYKVDGNGNIYTIKNDLIKYSISK
jgi:hypothetical protein